MHVCICGVTFHRSARIEKAMQRSNYRLHKERETPKEGLNLPSRRGTKGRKEVKIQRERKRTDFSGEAQQNQGQRNANKILPRPSFVDKKTNGGKWVPRITPRRRDAGVIHPPPVPSTLRLASYLPMPSLFYTWYFFWKPKAAHFLHLFSSMLFSFQTQIDRAAAGGVSK